MFDELKRTHAAGLAPKERARLTVFVCICLILGVTLLGLQTCSDEPAPDATEPETEQAPSDDPVVAPTRLDPDALRMHGSRDLGDGERAEILVDYPVPLITHLRTEVEGHPVDVPRLGPTELQSQPVEVALGQAFEVEGEVVGLVEQVLGDDTQRIWSVVIQDDVGGQVIGITHGLSSDGYRGQPVDDRSQTGRREVIEVGRYVVVRGYYVQRRTGTLGSVSIPRAAPVLWATNWRLELLPDERVPPVASLDEIAWSRVQDRFWKQTRAWNTPQALQTLQWARAQGAEKIAKMIEDGTIQATDWDQQVFGRWQKEVDVRSNETPRPVTEGARGKWFKTRGIVANVVYNGWSDIARNKYGIADTRTFDVMSDHYARQNIRNILAFPFRDFPKATGERKEHVWIYGVFYKNYTFESKMTRQGETRSSELTMPMFIVMHVEAVDMRPDPSYMRFMWWIAGSILLFGFAFWFFIVRGEAKESKRHEAQRLRLRRERRMKGSASAPETVDDADV